MKKKQLYELYKKNSSYILSAKPGIEAKKQKKIASLIFDKILQKNNIACVINILNNVTKIHTIVNDILKLNPCPIDQHAKSLIKGLINVFSSIEHGQKVNFVTILGVVPDTSKQQNECYIFDMVSKMIEKINSSNETWWRYNLVLSLHSEEIKSGNTNSGIDIRENIQSFTSIPICYPSEFFCKNSLRDLSEDEKSRIDIKISKVTSNALIKKAFSVLDERIIKNVRDYATFGKLFEESNIPIILIDLQKRIFPYQQPCYQIIRTQPLPVIPMQSFINNILQNSSRKH